MKGLARISQLRLAHNTHTTLYRSPDRSQPGIVTFYYELHPLDPARRPVAGTEIFDVYCRTCRTGVRVAVDAESVTMHRRRKRRLWGYAAALTAISMFVFDLVVFHFHGGAGVILPILGMITLYASLFAFGGDDGVAVYVPKGQSRRRLIHSIRIQGDTHGGRY